MRVTQSQSAIIQGVLIGRVTVTSRKKNRPSVWQEPGRAHELQLIVLAGPTRAHLTAAVQADEVDVQDSDGDNGHHDEDDAHNGNGIDGGSHGEAGQGVIG